MHTLDRVGSRIDTILDDLYATRLAARFPGFGTLGSMPRNEPTIGLSRASMELSSGRRIRHACATPKASSPASTAALCDCRCERPRQSRDRGAPMWPLILALAIVLAQAAQPSSNPKPEPTGCTTAQRSGCRLPASLPWPVKSVTRRSRGRRCGLVLSESLVLALIVSSPKVLAIG